MWRFTSGWRTWFLAHVLWLGAAGLASASFVGVEAELVDATEYGWTYRVYASFDAIDDEVVAVYGWAPAPMTLTVQAPLFQSSSGGPTAEGINPLFFAAFPDLAFDSWFALGSEDAGGTSALNQAGMEASFEAFEAGQGFVLDDEVGGTWFIAPGTSTEAFAGEDGRVLLGQMTATGLTEWTFNVQYIDANGESQNAEGMMVSLPQGVELGCTDAEACNYNADAVAEDGSCDYLSCAVYGCTDPIACNYIFYATIDDGSCEFCSCQRPASYTLTVEASPAVTPGMTVHRYYVNMLDASDRMSAVYGNNEDELRVEAPLGVFNSPYNTSWNALGVNAAFLPTFPDLADDSYATIGLTGPASASGQPGAADPSIVEDASQPFTPFFLNDGASELLSNTLTGASWYVLNTASNGEADGDQRVLVMQVTSSGNISGQLNYQVFPLGVGTDALTVQIEFDGVGVFGGVEEVALCGCTDATAANYNPESQYDDESCVYDVLGCDDPVACNYDETATLNNGSCDYTSCVVLGCLDPEADNYDPNATDDDGLCDYVGCTDDQALNWDGAANVDDGSCTYPEPSFEGVSVEQVGSGFPTEAHRTFRVYVDLSNPLDQLSAVFGDSEAPMTMSVGTNLYQAEGGATFATNLPAGDSSPETQADSWLTLGSDEPGGVMLSQAGLTQALLDFDAGTSWEVNSASGGLWFVVPDMEAAAFPDEDGRVLLGQFTTDGFVSWTFNIQYVAQNGESYSHEQLLVSFPDAAPGCTDEGACNFDAGAEVEDGSCDYNVCVGCTDVEACNYQPTSTVDDGSCNYPAEGYDCNGGCLLDSDGDGVCDPFEVEGCTLDLASNFDPLATDDDGSCVVTGCTEPTAENFDPIANEDDGSCVVLGCTDPFALNPNAIATEDDGSCEYPEPSFQGLTWEEVGQEAGGIPVYRVYANFTNPLDQVIAVFGDDDEPMTVSSTNGFAQASGSSAFAFDVLEPTTAQEDSWFTLGAEPGTTVAVTTIGTEGAASTFEAGGDFVLDAASGGAWFVFPDAEPAAFPDASGRVLLAQLVTDGQVTFVANLQHKAQGGAFNSEGGLSLLFPEGITGCTDPMACNYDALAQYEDGSCTYAEFALTCEGECVADEDADGICDEFEVEGCLDPASDNYVVNATDEVECLYSGCTNVEAENYQPGANVDDGSCIVGGCTYVGADNYDAASTFEDGSCIFSGCTNPLAVNYAPYVNNDDGSCLYDFSSACANGTLWDEELQLCVPDSSCGPGFVWNDQLQGCVYAYPSDANLDGCVDVQDFMDHLSQFGQGCND